MYLLVLLVVVVIVICFCYSKAKKETYGTPLGQLAPYQAFFSECINQCNRENPNRRLGEAGNWNCGVYCESIITDLAQKGIPPELLSVRNSSTTCEKQCDLPGYTKEEKDKCKAVCFGQNEVAKWCKELYCPYSLFDNDECMRQCVAVNLTNNNQMAWTWKMHG